MVQLAGSGTAAAVKATLSSANWPLPSVKLTQVPPASQDQAIRSSSTKGWAAKPGLAR